MMVKSGLRPIRVRAPHLIWLLVVILASACTLPTGNDKGTTEVEVSGPPEVRIVSPADNATYLEGVSIPIQVSISNAGSDVERVEFMVDGAVVATYPQPNPSGARLFSLTQPWPITAPGAHSIIVTAYRSDGTASTPAQVTVSIVDQSAQSVEASPTPTNTVAADVQPTAGDTQPNTQPTAADTQPTAVEEQPTAKPTDEPPPPTATSSKPMAHTLVGVNVRGGPGTVFNPPIGSLPPNTDTEILAKNPAGDWYKIVFWNGEGWVSAQTVSISGNTDNMPVDAGPATPAPTAPPAPTATTPPASNVNLVIVNVAIDPHPFQCGKSSSIQVTVKNEGSEATASGGKIRVTDILQSTNENRGSTEGIFPPLAAGESYTSQMYLQIDVNIDEGHNTVTTIDADNQVNESNENDNQSVIPYILQRGGC
jgi:hypothetical protein